MPSVLATVAEKVKDLLVAGEADEAFATSITAIRAYEVVLRLEDSGTLHCDVVPISITCIGKRGDLVDYEIIVDIGIRYGFVDTDRVDATGKINVASVDAYVLLLEEINQYLNKRVNRTLSSSTAFLRSAEIVIAWDADHLNHWSQYTGIIRATYQQEVDIS